MKNPYECAVALKPDTIKKLMEGTDMSETTILHLASIRDVWHYNSSPEKKQIELICRDINYFVDYYWAGMKEKERYQNDAFESRIIGLLGLMSTHPCQTIHSYITNNVSANAKYVAEYLTQNLQEYFPDMEVICNGRMLKIKDKEACDELFRIKVSGSHYKALDQFTLTLKRNTAAFCYGDYFIQKGLDKSESYSKKESEQEEDIELGY